MSYGETIEERDGYRLRIVADEDPIAPDGDGQGTTFVLDWSRCEYVAGPHRATCDIDDVASAIESGWARWRDLDMVARHLRMFYDVVGFDYFDTRDSASYLNVVTTADLKMWGWDSVAEYRQATGQDNPASENLTEWKACVEGDVWFYDVEKRVTWTTTEPDYDDMETWETVDSCGGFYGQEYAIEEGRAALESYAPTGVKA